ncbi:unnamed protein product, partial [marine sediment metagenome]
MNYYTGEKREVEEIVDNIRECRNELVYVRENLNKLGKYHLAG